MLNMHWSWDTTQYVSKLVVASINDEKKWFTELFHINSTPKVIN